MDQLDPDLGYSTDHGDAMTPHVHYSEPPISAITGLAVPPFLSGDTPPPFLITCTSTRRCLRCRPHGDAIPDISLQAHHVSIKYDVRVDDYRYEHWTWDDLQLAVMWLMESHHLPRFQLRYEGSQNGYFQVQMYRLSGLRKFRFPDEEDAGTVEETVVRSTNNEAALNNTAVEAPIDNTVVWARINNKAVKAAVPIWMSKIDPQLQKEYKAAARRSYRALMKKNVAEAAANNHGDIPIPLSNIDPRLQGDDRAVVQPPVAEVAANNHDDIPLPLSNIDPRLQAEDATVVQPPVDESALDHNATMMAEFVGPLERSVAAMDDNGDIPMTTSDIDPRLREEDTAAAQNPVDETVMEDDGGEFTKLMAGTESFEWDVLPMDYNGDLPMAPIDAPYNGDNGAAVADTGMDAVSMSHIDETVTTVRNAGDHTAMDGLQPQVTGSDHPYDQTVVARREDHPARDNTGWENVVRTADEDATIGGLQHETHAYVSDDQAVVGGTEDTAMGEGTEEKAVLGNTEDDIVMDRAQGVTGVGDTEDSAAGGNTAGRRIVHKRKASDDLDDLFDRRPTVFSPEREYAASQA